MTAHESNVRAEAAERDLIGINSCLFAAQV
jgi:hypothetical protein